MPVAGTAQWHIRFNAPLPPSFFSSSLALFLPYRGEGVVVIGGSKFTKIFVIFNCPVNGEPPENAKEKAMRLLRVTWCPKLGGDQMTLLSIAQVDRLGDW